MSLRLSIVLLALMCTPVNAGVVFSTDFNSGLPAQFSGAGTTEPVQGYGTVGTFSGDFLRNDTAGNPQPATTLTLNGLPAHTSIDINFLFAPIDSWDGDTQVGGTVPPDYFNVRVDGTVIFSETFDNFVLADGSYSPPVGGLLSSGTNLGFNGGWPDSAYDMGLETTFDAIPHSGNSLVLDFFVTGAGWQAGTDESWAIENLEVIVNDIPEPMSIVCWILLGLTTAHTCSRRRRIALRQA